MDPLAAALVRRLDLPSALADELSAYQNLLPDPPLLERLADNSGAFSGWLAARLRDGLEIAPQEVAAARKAGHGVRPVPIVGIVERVTYRALAKLLLGDRAQLDRSPSAYVRFVQAPIFWSREQADADDLPVFKVFNSEIRHVVKADLAAFYQYVDHELLAGELLNISSEFEAVSALQEFLSELMGKAFGLPQLLDPSDWLSDIYADLVERDMLRRRYAVWRFNDDFRVACISYSEALHAIEALGESSRSVGLTLNESKTVIVRFITYAIDTMGLRADDEIPPSEQQDVEVTVADYTEVDDSADAAQSLDLIRQSTQRIPASPDDSESDHGEAPEGTVDLRRLRVDDFRRLRRALRALARTVNPEAISDCMALAVYAPSLTPDICRYLIAVIPTAMEQVQTTISSILQEVSLSDWQVMWMFRVARATELLRARPDWMKRKIDQWRHGRSAFLQAEVVLGMAEASAVNLDAVDVALRLQPKPLLPWYLAAVEALSQPGDPSMDRYIEALRSSDRLYEWLLQAPN